jgi:IS30 family transposase
LRKKKYSLRAIARTLGRSANTIKDELKRNHVKGCYDATKAQQKAYARRRNARFQGKKIVERRELRNFIEKKLKEGRSPESIAGRVTNHENDLPSISADSIERFMRSVHGRKVEAHRNKLKKKKKRRPRRQKTTVLADRTFIDKRPKIIEKRQRVGDTEADFIVSGKSGKGHLLTVADRKIRTAFLEKVFPVSIARMEKAFLKIKQRYPEMRTVTTDNDLLFKYHKRLEKLLQVKIYFCHPYHSWEKGTIENVNGEIRKDIPRGSDLSRYTRQQLRVIETKLNDRYMTCLNFSTPQEMLNRHRKQKNAQGVRRKKKSECTD